MESAHPARALAKFGLFEIDSRTGELRKNGLRIKLQKQPFQVLQILLEHRGQLVTREELQQRIWPADTFVDFDQGLSNAIKRLREALCDSADTPRFIETVPRRGYRFVATFGETSGRIESIAVLPLEDLSHDPQQEYFSEGLTEALITSLAKISALRIVSRTTVMQYKNVRNKSVAEIARELGVDAIVEGTVLRSADRVRISAQLINASTDTHLWAESYDRDLRDILSLQSEVARAIAREIQVTVTPGEQAQLAKARQVDPEAYEAYLKGRHYWNRRSTEALKKAFECFQRAIDRDPSYSLAHVGLADCAGIAGFWSFTSPADGCGRAKIVARKALEMEDTAEAHASSAWAIMHYDWDLRAAESEFQKAIQINGRYSHAHQWYGHCLGCMGRFSDAFAELRHAIRLDPLSLIVNTSYAGISWLGRQWDQAIDQTEKTLELDPTFAAGWWARARSYDSKGNAEAAIAYAHEAINVSGGFLFYVTDLGHAYASAGKTAEALEIVEHLKELSRQRYVDAAFIAQIYAALGERDKALQNLETAYDQRSAWMCYLAMDPWFDPLRSERRFQKLLQAVRSNHTG
jgi:TolB-like protein/Tfp pilus assembly protein PilF